jgi:hypothetical protein
MEDHLAHHFPVRIDLVLERKTALPSWFSRERNAQIIPNKPIQVN